MKYSIAKQCCCVLMLFSVFIASAHSPVDSLLNKLNSPIHDTVRIGTLISLSKEISLSKDSTFAFAMRSVEFAEKIKLNDWIAKSYVALGLWHLNTGKDADTAIAIWHKLYENMKKENYLRGMALAYRFLGKAFLFKTSDSAIYYNIKSIEMFESLKDTQMVNSIKVNLAVVYAQSGRELEGIALSKEAMISLANAGNIADAGTAAVNVGYFYEWIGEYDSATVYFNKSYAFNKQRGDPVGMGHGKSKLADMLFRKKKFAEAEKMYLEVLQSGKEIKSDRLLNYGYNGLAAISFERGNWNDAIKNYELGYQYSGKNTTEEMKYRENLFKSYQGNSDYKNALNNYLSYSALRDSFNNAERLKKVDELEAKYQNREKQDRIELLNKENKIQSAEAERQQFIRNSIIIFSVVILIVGGLLFNRFKLKKQIESQQALLAERKRISSELHDDLGAQLSTARMFLTRLKDSEKNGEQHNIIENSLKILDGSINDLRKIMNDLQTSTLQESGLIAAIEEMVNRINELQTIKFSLTCHNLQQRLQSKFEHNLFRITQELINNSMKYANASKVSIDFTVRDEQVILIYEDDGQGVDLQKVSRGYGIINIESRAKSMGGTVDFDSQPGKGFIATIEMPLKYASAKS